MPYNYKVGDTVYGNFTRYNTVDVREGRVVKVTPTGRINVDFGLRYAGNGEPRIIQFMREREVGGDRYHAAMLINSETYGRMKSTSDRHKAYGRLNSAIRQADWITTKADAEAFIQKISAAVALLPGDDQ